MNSGDTAAIVQWSARFQARRHSTRVHNAAVEKRLAAITAQDSQRADAYPVRAEAERARFNLPAWPTTTIGSSRKPPRFVVCVWTSKRATCCW
ncbi:hypothetical protein ACNKHK_24935 [Shigella flexneri]